MPYHALEAIAMADLVERGELLPLTTKQEKLIEEVCCGGWSGAKGSGGRAGLHDSNAPRPLLH